MDGGTRPPGIYRFGLKADGRLSRDAVGCYFCFETRRGARVGSHRCPILRPGIFSISTSSRLSHDPSRPLHAGDRRRERDVPLEAWRHARRRSPARRVPLASRQCSRPMPLRSRSKDRLHPRTSLIPIGLSSSNVATIIVARPPAANDGHPHNGLQHAERPAELPTFPIVLPLFDRQVCKKEGGLVDLSESE